MSVPAAAGAVGATGHSNPVDDVHPAANNVAETATDPVPPPSETAVVEDVAPAVEENVPEPPAEPTDGGDNMDDLKQTVNDLTQTVAGLVETVKGLIPSDDGPTKVPWTHLGSK